MLGLTDENITFPEDRFKDTKIKGVNAQLISASLTYKPTHCKKWGIKKSRGNC